jgi:bacterial/archaeal transporter family protein
MSLIPTWLLFAAIALVFWGVTGVTQKLSTNRISSELSFLPMHWHVRPQVLWLAIVGGTLNGLGALTSFTALESGGKASIVISLVSLYPLLTVAFAVVVLHEHLTVVQGVGVVTAIVAAILLSLEPEAAPPASER